MAVKTKRVYVAPARQDGKRVLVDRLWPRGLKKEDAHVDVWLKDIAPSNELRKWYHTRPSQWLKFRERYIEELGEPAAAAALEELYELASAAKNLTLLFGSKNEDQNNATVLQQLLNGMRKPPRSTGPERAAAGRKAAAARR